MTAPEVFYSYAHTDEPLLGELRKHLAALERAQLIRGWYDRKIEPGSQWAPEIQAAMERAGIILLLISADFIASNYCFTIEVPFALKRIQAGVLVIPIMLRPVEWRDLPIAQLQALPTDARAVTLWPNRDEAFTDIATHLREVIYAKRLASEPASPGLPASTVTVSRVLDAAVATFVLIEEPAEVVTMIRLLNSAGLKAVLAVETSFNAKPEDVRSSTFELELKVDPTGKVLPAALELKLESPGCDPPVRTKKLRVSPDGDSAVCVFLFTPKKAGRLVLNLEVRYDDVGMGSSHLVTMATAPSEAGAAPAPYALTSLPLSTTTFAWPASRIQSVIPPWAPDPPLMHVPPTPVPSPPQVRASRKQDDLRPNARRNWLTPPVMAGASAAGLLIVAGITFLNFGGSKAVEQAGSTNPSSNGSPFTPVPPPRAALLAERIPAYREGIAAAERKDYLAAAKQFSAALEIDPNSAELYWRRAEAYKALSKVDLAKQDLDQSIALDPNHAYAHILKGELAQAESNHELAVKEYRAAQASPIISPENKAFLEDRLKTVK